MKIIFVLILLAIAYTKPLNPKKVLYAINCGAPSSYKSPVGITYERDIQTDPETVAADYMLNSEVASQVIKFTREPNIYMTERHAYKSFSYKIPLSKQGTYVLILKFAEMYFREPGKRMFHINFGKRRVVENLDIFQKVGRYAAHDEYIEFEYTAGRVFFDGLPCLDAVVDNNLLITLDKTKHDNPYIHGIVLYAGNLQESDYEEYKNLKANWEKVQAAEQRKKEEERLRKEEAKIKRKEKVKVRNDHLNELEVENEQDEPVPQKEAAPTKLGIRQLIMSPAGVAVLWAMFGVLVMGARQVFNQIESTNVPVQVQEKEKEKPQPTQQPQKQTKQKAKKQ